ncbi:unnamed protein product [Amaranthus hypochondriacus]
MTATNNPSPPSSTPLTRTESPPWTQIVRGPEPEPEPGLVGAPIEGGEKISSPAPENSDDGGNVGGSKKPAWNKKPSHGPAENSGPGLVVMGPAEAWPALCESTKASPKLSSSDSPNNLPEFGSVSSPKVTGTEPSSSSLASPVQPQLQSSTSQKSSTGYMNHNSMPNYGRTTRQKSMKRDGGSNPQANGGFSHQPSSPAEGSLNISSSKPSADEGSDSSGRDNFQNHGHRESGSRNVSGDHPSPRNTFRRGGGGSHQNFRGRRGDQDRGSHVWNHSRSFNGRDANMQPRVSPRSNVRPPPVSSPFGHPAPLRPFIHPMVAEFPVFYLPPFGAPAPGHVFIPSPDAQLNAKIVNQIDYYFSNENLIRDTYLRQNMDEHGWVPVALIAKFRKVQELTENIQQILDAVRSSIVVEAQGDKIRKREDWVRWIMPPSVQIPIATGTQSPKSPTIDALSSHIENLKMDEKTIEQNHPKDVASSSGR